MKTIQRYKKNIKVKVKIKVFLLKGIVQPKINILSYT